MSYENPTQHYSQNEFAYDEPQPAVSKYDTQRLAINLAILTILGGVVAFAAIFLVQATIESFLGNGLPEMTGAVILAAFAAVVGLLFGPVYLPIDGTGNEGLYKVAIIALALGGRGVPKAEIARRLGVGRSTLYRYLSPGMGVNDNGSQITTPGGHLDTAENIKA